MGIHIVGEMVAKMDFSSWEDGAFRVRAVPEESTNDLGFPLIVATKRGELKVFIYEDWIEVPLGDRLALRLKVAAEGDGVELSFTLPYREWIGSKEVIRLNDGPLRTLAAEMPDRQEFIKALREVALALVTVLADAEEIFKSGPLGPKGWRHFGESDE